MKQKIRTAITMYCMRKYYKHFKLATQEINQCPYGSFVYRLAILQLAVGDLWWEIGNIFAPKKQSASLDNLGVMICGHNKKYVVQGDEGTAYCSECERQANSLPTE